MATVSLKIDVNEWTKVQGNPQVRQLVRNDTDAGKPGGTVIFDWSYDTVGEANHVCKVLGAVLMLNDVQFDPKFLYVE